MGYRHYMYQASKEFVDELKGMSYEELEARFGDEDGWFSFTDLLDKEIFGFGKLYWCDTARRIYSKGVPMFEKEEVMEELRDYEPYIVGKEGLLEAIEVYKQKVIDYYKSLEVDDEDGEATTKQQGHIKEKLREWTRDSVLDLNMDKEKITRSWEYEYNLFELVRLLKTIDFEKDTIVFCGW